MEIETYTIEHTIEAEDLFSSIAQELQNDSLLDKDYDGIIKALESEKSLSKYVTVTFTVAIDIDKKEIYDIY